MSDIQVYRPDVDLGDTPTLKLATRSPLKDVRLTIIDNGKPNANVLIGFIVDELRGSIGIKSVNVIRKYSASEVIDGNMVSDIAEASDVVIAGLGDCGACSACSLGDALKMEEAGIPATVVITDAFNGHVAHLAANLGMHGYRSAVVPHPIASKSVSDLRHMAAQVADDIASYLQTAPEL